MKKYLFIIFLFITTLCSAQINDEQPMYFKRSNGIITPRTAGNSISVDSVGGIIISGDLTYHAIPFPTGTPADNQIIKYDAALSRFAFEADAGGSGGHVIQDEGGAGLTQRANLNFVGAGVTASDGGAGPDSTIITIPGGAGSPGGADTQIQFNDASSFGGSPNFRLYKLTGAMRIAGVISSDVVSVDSSFTLNGLPMITIISTDIGVIKPQVTQMSTDAVIWNTGALTFILNGGGSALTTANKAWLTMPYAAKIISWEVAALPSGSVTLDVMRDTASNFPPIASDTLTGTFKPFLTNNVLSSDTTLAGWTTNLNQYDCIMASVDSATTCTQATLTIKIKKN